MSNKNVIIDLKARPDGQGKTFYVGKIEAPIMIDCSKGVAFLIFVSARGEEQLQIAPMDRREDREDD